MIDKKLYNRIVCAINNGNIGDCLYLDYCISYCQIQHSVLLDSGKFLQISFIGEESNKSFLSKINIRLYPHWEDKKDYYTRTEITLLKSDFDNQLWCNISYAYKNRYIDFIKNDKIIKEEKFRVDKLNGIKLICDSLD